MALDDNEDLYVGILNQNIDYGNLTDFLWSIARAPFGKKWDAIVDAALRQWSGIPVFSNEGAQIYRYNTHSTGTETIPVDFELKHQTSSDHVGFRKMINYQGNIYAGSTNGPDGPYDGEPYDFEFYKEGTGAQVSSEK